MRRVAALHSSREVRVHSGHGVRRALPRRERRCVGPFVLLDDLGPTSPVDASVFQAHPHAGLESVTYLLSGELEHADSLGHLRRVLPGDVHWLTAGRGLVHAERMRAGASVHLVQAWVALPANRRRVAPLLQSHLAETLPAVRGEHWRARVLAGALMGARSPVEAHADLVLADLEVSPGAVVELDVDPAHELAIYVAGGRLRLGDRTADPCTLAVLTDRDDRVAFASEGGAHVLLLGGARDQSPTTIWSNFVTDSIEDGQALESAWQQGRFDGQEWTPPW